MPRLQRRRERRFVGAGLGELLRELLVVEPRRLLLQAQVADALAERRELLLATDPLLVGRPKPLRRLVLSSPSHRQALLALDPDPERFLECEPEPFVLQAGKLGFRLRPVRLALRQLLRNNLN